MTLLKDEEDNKTAWNYLALCAWRAGVQVVAFVLMSNHIHVQITCRDIKSAQKLIRHFKQLLSTYLRNKYGLSKVMHCTNDSISLIDSVQYLRNCIAYIFRNPVSAKLCARPEDYKWSSYHSSFSVELEDKYSKKVCDLTYTEKRNLLKTGGDLTSCPLFINTEGYIVLESFVKNEILARTFRHSGKSFLYHLGCCNDAKMEYELVYQPLMNVTDYDMYDMISKYVAQRFPNKQLSELTTSEKCSILKSLFFNYKTTIPQLSRIMGLPRILVKKMLLQ